jgi:hypothetical protein
MTKQCILPSWLLSAGSGIYKKGFTHKCKAF